MTDVQFSVMALLDEAANVVERVSYDAYGNARHRRPADLDGDGLVGSDNNLYSTTTSSGIGTSNYSADLDLDRDGTIGGFMEWLDEYLDWYIDGGNATPVPDGHISETDAAAMPNVAVAPDNPIGYCGYVFNPEVLAAAQSYWEPTTLREYAKRLLDIHPIICTTILGRFGTAEDVKFLEERARSIPHSAATKRLLSAAAAIQYRTDGPKEC